MKTSRPYKMSGNSNTIVEQEVSYTFTYSQDVLYRLKDWLDKNLNLHDEYIEVIDKNDVRTRISNNKIVSVIKKKVVEVNRMVIVCDVNLVPMTKRECTETVYTICDTEIKRLCKTRLYMSKDDIEIKFEQIYYEYNTGDILDPLTASKQIALYNLLNPIHMIDITINSHLGTDEILANCRLELEYNTILDLNILKKAANLINHIETSVLTDVVLTPFVSHTNIFNEICYRPFVEEKLLNVDSLNDIVLFALKLDGTRGKAHIINGVKMYVQLDDMQMFEGELENVPALFLNNRIVGVQIEYIESSKRLYITDILNVYKYCYDNRNQYDVTSSVSVDIFDSITFLNQSKNLSFKFNDLEVYFQYFVNHVHNVNLHRENNDGYVGVNNGGSLVKIKTHRSLEMLYIGNGCFECSFGKYYCEARRDWKNNTVYEVLVSKDNFVKVLKERPDRLISN